MKKKAIVKEILKEAREKANELGYIYSRVFVELLDNGKIHCTSKPRNGLALGNIDYLGNCNYYNAAINEVTVEELKRVRGI